MLCAGAWSASSLIAFRVVQAAGACAMAPTAVSYIGELFAPRERGQALGILSAVISIAPIFALNTAGALLAVFGWRSVFWFTPIVGAFVLAGALIVLPELRGPPGPRSFDLAGAALGGIGLLGLLLGVSRGESWGFASPAAIACLAIGAIGIWLFILRERRIADPLLNLALLRLRSVRASNLAAWASAAALFGVLILLPFYMSRVLGFGPIALGLRDLADRPVVHRRRPVGRPGLRPNRARADGHRRLRDLRNRRAGDGARGGNRVLRCDRAGDRAVRRRPRDGLLTGHHKRHQ